MPKLQLPQSDAVLAEPAGSFFTALRMWRLSRMGRGDLSARGISPDVESHALTAIPFPVSASISASLSLAWTWPAQIRQTLGDTRQEHLGSVQG